MARFLSYRKRHMHHGLVIHAGDAVTENFRYALKIEGLFGSGENEHPSRAQALDFGRKLHERSHTEHDPARQASIHKWIH
jgi:hypothetical protein